MISNLEYRVNFITDAVIQPVLTTLIELTLWIAVFHSTTQTTIGGFSRAYYLSYALWAAFIARITSNWMYEYRMIEEIDTGSINGILSRPVSYFEYYWSQFFGYKLLTSGVSLLVPLSLEFFIDTPVKIERLPLSLVLIVYYVFHIYIVSFCVTTFAFFFNRVYSITMAKNLVLWLLAGELFPLDLLPEPWKTWLISLPFCAGVYIPVGYITGRFGVEQVWRSFTSVTIGVAVFGAFALVMWNAGLRRYTGTGA